MRSDRPRSSMQGILLGSCSEILLDHVLATRADRTYRVWGTDRRNGIYVISLLELDSCVSLLSSYICYLSVQHFPRRLSWVSDDRFDHHPRIFSPPRHTAPHRVKPKSNSSPSKHPITVLAPYKPDFSLRPRAAFAEIPPARIATPPRLPHRRTG